MPRSSVTTHVAGLDDLPVLVALSSELRGVGRRVERALSPTGVGDVEALLAGLISGECSQVVMACCGNEPAGLAIMRLVQPDPLSDVRMLQLAHLLVSQGYRHRGVGRALVEAAAVFAAESRVEHVAVSVFPSLRDASRFYARLGFAPAAVHRTATVGLLRRRLGPDHAIGSEAARRRLIGRRGALL